MDIQLQSLGQHYENRWVFKNLTYDIIHGDSVAFLGANGSGKSTLVQICSAFLSPSEGEIRFSLRGKTMEVEKVYQHLSISAPYIELIEEMNLQEFLDFHFSFKKPLLPISDMIRRVGLAGNEDVLLEHFSSGMKQRVSLAQAIFTDASLLLLDEPCSNLDEEGVALYHTLLSEFSKGRTVVVASNDKKEYGFCKKQILIQEFK